MKNFKRLFASLTAVLMLATTFPTTVLGASYSSELTEAYTYAFEKSVTTMDSIDDANMYGALTRVALAKMISNWSMDVLGLTPDTSIDCDFADVSDSLDADYDNGVTNACQLGLMGVGIDAFRPYDSVTRAEFGTVLSRAMWGEENNGGTPYYADHLAALEDAGIMNNISNPDMAEVRGYVMLMMMRADESGAAEGAGCTAEELLACITATDYDACVAACSEVTEEEEEVIDEVKAGTLTVDLNAGTPDGDLPVAEDDGDALTDLGISRVPLLIFDVEADDADIVLHSITLEFLGYGDYDDLEDVSVYTQDNVKISKTKNFADEELTITFENDFVVKNGGSETLTVVGKLVEGAEPNTTYGVSVTELSTSAEEVEGLPIEGNKMKAVVVTSQTVLLFDDGIAPLTETITVGEEKKLAAFTLQNDDNYEDVEVQSITILVDGVDDDIFANLDFYADGQEIASDLEVVNGELVINMDYVLAKDSNDIEFELRGSVNEMDDDGITFTVENSESILAIGQKYGFNITSDVGDDIDVGTFTIQGSEIATSFDKSDIDEAKPDAEDVLLGTLKFKSADSDYTINSYSICVDTSNLSGGIDGIKDLTLGGNSYDDANAAACTGGEDEFVYEDISLPAGQQVNLQLVVDFDGDPNVIEDDDVSFDVSLDNNIDVTDEDNDEDYTEVSTELDDIFSTTSFTAKAVTIQGPTFDMITTTLNNREVVLGTQEELVFKGKISIGDAEDVTLKTIYFNDTGSGVVSDLVQNATLSIGGATYSDTDIETTRIEFSNINHEFTAGDSNVIVELVVQLKTDDIVGGETLIFSTQESDITVVDTDTDNLDAANVTVDDNTESCTMTLTEEGELTIEFEKDDVSTTTMNNFTETSKFALAGATEKVLLAKIKLSADREDMKVEKLTFTGTDTGGDFYNSYEDMYFSIDGGTTFIGTPDVTYATNVMTIQYTFASSTNFLVSKSTPKYAYLYATVKATDLDPNAAEAGAVDGATLADLRVTDVEFKGQSSELDEVDLDNTLPTTTAEDTVIVVNTIAEVELEAVEGTLVEGTDQVIGKLIITPTTQNRNKDDEGDVLNAYLSALTITGAGTDIDIDALNIRLLGGTTLSDGADIVTDLGEDAEINGVTTYEILADLSNRTDAEASVQLKINNVTTDVDFGSMTGGSLVNRLLAPGLTRQFIVNTN